MLVCSAGNSLFDSEMMSGYVLAEGDAKGHAETTSNGGETKMRSIIAIAASAAMLIAQVPVAPARADIAPPAPQVVSENSGIAKMFKGFPNGGDGLSKQVADAIVANPKLAPDLVIYMRGSKTLNRAQKLAAEHGLAAAADQLRIKAADMGVPITKDMRPPIAPQEDLWLIALAILAVGAAICIAACGEHHDNPVVPVSIR